MRRESMKRMHLIRLTRSILVLLQAVLLVLIVLPARAQAGQSRVVRVAFFPMEGFHIYSDTDGYGGMDVAYLEELSSYTNWDIEYVECDSWNAALEKLEAREVDLVGSAQKTAPRSIVPFPCSDCNRSDIHKYLHLFSPYSSHNWQNEASPAPARSAG